MILATQIRVSEEREGEETKDDPGGRAGVVCTVRWIYTLSVRAATTKCTHQLGRLNTGSVC
jgi:hypothetical protein